MCNLQGSSRSSGSIALLLRHHRHEFPLTPAFQQEDDAAAAAVEPSSACLWAMVNDFLDKESASVPASHNAFSRSGSFIASTGTATADAVLTRAIQEMDSIVGTPVSTSDVEARIVDCVTASLNAEASGACANTEQLVLPSLLQCLQGEAFKAALCVTERKLASGAAASSLPPTGGHKYIDVILGEEPVQAIFSRRKLSDRVIVDIGFRGHFEIARPLPAYQKLISMLPSTFIGKAELLQRVVRIMCKAARASLESQDMPIPPWRTFSFLCAKWFSSACTRISSLEEASHVVLNGSTTSRNKTQIFVERYCGSDPANVTRPASDWAACSSASTRFPSQGDGAQARLLWQISSTDQNGEDDDNDNDDGDSISGNIVHKKRVQANVVSALALALAESSRIHMLTEQVASTVQAHSSRPKGLGAAAAVSVL